MAFGTRAEAAVDPEHAGDEHVTTQQEAGEVVAHKGQERGIWREDKRCINDRDRSQSCDMIPSL
jgi:hypothetical protein